MPSRADFDSDFLIPWKDIKEGNTLYHKGITYEVAFKSVRKRAIEGIMTESKQILYLRAISDGENVIGEIDEDHLYLLMCDLRKNIGTGKRTPSTGLGYESWTEDYLDSLKEELEEKIGKIRRLMTC